MPAAAPVGAQLTQVPVGEGTLALDTVGGRLLLLNASGSLVADMLREGLPAQAIAAAAAARFGLSASAALQDVEALAARLQPPPASKPLPGAGQPADRFAAPVFEAVVALSPLRVRVRSKTPRAPARLLDKLAHRRVEDGGETVLELVETEDRALALLRDGQKVAQAWRRPGLAGHLYQTLLRLEHPGRDPLCFLHAAAVVLDGRSVLLAGASGSGKTTLAAGLVTQCGAAYLGDELVAVEAVSNALLPLPTALAAKPSGWPAMAAMLRPEAAHGALTDQRGVRHLDPAGLGAVLRDGPPATALVFPRYAAGARLDAVPLRPDEALRRLLDDGFGAGGQDPAGARLDRLADWLRRTPAWALGFGDGGEACSWLRTLLADAS